MDREDDLQLEIDVLEDEVRNYRKLIVWLAVNTHYVGFAATMDCPEKDEVRQVVNEEANRK